MQTPAGLKQAVETNLKRDPDYYRKLGARGGAKSSSRPMADPSYASKLGKISSQKRGKKTTDCPVCGEPFIALAPHMRKHNKAKDPVDV